MKSICFYIYLTMISFSYSNCFAQQFEYENRLYRNSLPYFNDSGKIAIGFSQQIQDLSRKDAFCSQLVARYRVVHKRKILNNIECGFNLLSVFNNPMNIPVFDSSGNSLGEVNKAVNGVEFGLVVAKKFIYKNGFKFGLGFDMFRFRHSINQDEKIDVDYCPKCRLNSIFHVPISSISFLFEYKQFYLGLLLNYNSESVAKDKGGFSPCYIKNNYFYYNTNPNQVYNSFSTAGYKGFFYLTSFLRYKSKYFSPYLGAIVSNGTLVYFGSNFTMNKINIGAEFGFNVEKFSDYKSYQRFTSGLSIKLLSNNKILNSISLWGFYRSNIVITSYKVIDRIFLGANINFLIK